jgi:Immunity protein Imm1
MKSLKSVRMAREPDLDVPDPTSGEVVRMMRQLVHENKEPLLVLTYDSSSQAGPAIATQLWIVRVNSRVSGEAAGWFVRWRGPKGAPSQVLARTRSLVDSFKPVELFGAWENVREECLVEQPVVEQAVHTFLESGEPNQALVWLNFRDCLRGE